MFTPPPPMFWVKILENVVEFYTVTIAHISTNKKAIQSSIVTRHLTKRNNKILLALPPQICSSEETPSPPPPLCTRAYQVNPLSSDLTQNQCSQTPITTLPLKQTYIHHNTSSTAITYTQQARVQAGGPRGLPPPP